jgi:hypothetical protein
MYCGRNNPHKLSLSRRGVMDGERPLKTFEEIQKFKEKT